MGTTYDAIVVGARCAGSPTAMLLARKGYRVLLIDRATFPSDTMSTHVLHPPAMAALARWGLADRLIATGCPPLHKYSFDFEHFVIAAEPRRPNGEPMSYAPRRTVLDNLLVEAAREAGVEVREGFSVDELSVEDGTVTGIRGHGKDGTRTEERALVVIGADGVNSFVAKSVRAPSYNERPAAMAMYYAYWKNMPTGNTFEIHLTDERALVAIPTHNDETCVVVAWSIDEFEANKKDVEGNYLAGLHANADFAQRMSRATRTSKFTGTTAKNFYREPHGPGWALVGDAGYHKDPCTAMGITDAFRDAEVLVEALADGFAGRRDLDEALAEYQQQRDDVTAAMYDLTVSFASFEPPPPEMQQLLAAVAGNPQASQDFISVQASTMPVPEFFDPANVARIIGASSPVGAATH